MYFFKVKISIPNINQYMYSEKKNVIEINKC